MLNDDDALELFKKTLPSASAAFVQLDTTAAEVKERALALIQEARRRHHTNGHGLSLDLIVMALRGKKAGFEKIIKLIDDMVVTLGKEQEDDDKKKDYCNAELDAAEDKKKETERTIQDLETKLSEAEDAIGTLTDEIKALEDGITELDKNVVKATEQRKEENAEYTELMASNTAAKQLVEMAKNRMNKFYNPKMYKAPPKRELTEEQRITQNMGGTLEPTPPPGGIAGTGITAFDQSEESPVSFLQSKTSTRVYFSEAYRKQAEASNGVIAMMDMMINDIKTENTEATMEEKDSQEDYETMMANAKTKRKQDTNTITEKEAVKAELETEFQKNTDAKKAQETELAALQEFNQNLHKECDWLLQNYDVRREARGDEIAALNKAKMVLETGAAASSFLQLRAQTHTSR